MAVAKSPELANIPIVEESSTGSAVAAPRIGSGVGALVGADVGGFVMTYWDGGQSSKM
jgi:hypothetical protein